MLQKIKTMLPERVKGPILAKVRPVVDPELESWRGRKKVVIALAGFYQNLGDMALTYAQKKFIEATLPGYEVLLFPSNYTYSHMKALKRSVGPGDIITTIAGGNMDDLYPSLENARRFIVRSFPNNPVISFPQTMSFANTPSGRRALKRSARTYASHQNLTIFGRENVSYNSMTAGFRETQIGQCPDIVLSLDPEECTNQRSGIMLSIRVDKESVLTPHEKESISEILRTKTEDILIRDTVDVELEDCQPDTFENTLQDFWKLVGTRRVVVTDRLHGMIFCAITRTPVVVLSNSNHKIRGTYEAWLKGFSFIRYLETFDRESFEVAIEEMWNLHPQDIAAPDLGPQYESLRKALIVASGQTPE